VIVPVRGPAPWLGEALDAILAQDPPPARVVVVDDASPEPVVLAREHAARCELVRRAEPGGAPAARATGLERLGDAELVALADADDVWEPGKLRAQVEALARHPEASLCFGRATVIGPDGAPTGESWAEASPGALSPAGLAPVVFVDNPIPTSSVVVRAEAVHAAGGFESPHAPAEDMDLWLRLLALGRPFVHEPAARIRYRRHPGGLTADVAALARARLSVHEAHAGLVDEETRRAVRATDLRTLARGHIRAREWNAAHAALAEAASCWPPSPRDRALAALVRIPGLRAALGRRDPYGGRSSAALFRRDPYRGRTS
jgi:glycosyltransferase involved in cell wall biosynthesis